MRARLQKIGRSATRMLLRVLLSWSKLPNPTPGFSIILGTPWALRELLEVNLRFIVKTNTENLERIYIMFDRRKRPDAETFIVETRQKFPELPLEFHFYPSLVGALVEWVNQSKFYASLCWVTGLRRCQSRYAILHDFDLYPTAKDYFTKFVDAIKKDQLQLCGLQYTKFGGLTDADKIFGSWGLGIDVPWIRATHQPVDCFHTTSDVLGRSVDFDPFAYIQAGNTNRRLVADVEDKDFAHVMNLVSTHMRFHKGEKVKVAWRLNYLWYLESLVRGSTRLVEVTKKMNEATSASLTFEHYQIDFADVHVTCSNVLTERVLLMEKFLFGEGRKEVTDYLSAFSEFLNKYGEKTEIPKAA